MPLINRLHSILKVLRIGGGVGLPEYFSRNKSVYVYVPGMIVYEFRYLGKRRSSDSLLHGGVDHIRQVKPG